MNKRLPLKRWLGRADVVLLTLDTLRFDIAEREFARGALPHFRTLFPDGFEARDSPGSFTFAAHSAFFAGFLPTPKAPGPHPRALALAFGGSESIDSDTLVFDAPTIIDGFRDAGYHTTCVGGTGFFNPETPLGRVLSAPFAERHFNRSLGVGAKDSPRAQFECARQSLEAQPKARVFLFVNLSAMHQPNAHYVPGLQRDNLESHAAALRAVDSQLPILLEALRARGPAAIIATSDHGTLYGEEGHHGHRVGHPLVWTVPYAETMLLP